MEIVDRVAEALRVTRNETQRLLNEKRAEQGLWPDHTFYPPDKILARAAIAAVFDALAQPSEGMVQAGWDADIPGGRIGEDTFTEARVGEDDVPVIWRSMLAQARKEALEP